MTGLLFLGGESVEVLGEDVDELLLVSRPWKESGPGAHHSESVEGCLTSSKSWRKYRGIDVAVRGHRRMGVASAWAGQS